MHPAGALLAVGFATLVNAQEPWVPAGAEVVTGSRFSVAALAGDAPLARTLLAHAIANDSFPGLPRSTRRVTILIAPSAARFREWVGRGVPEWGIAVAIPSAMRVIMQGRAAASSAGNPVVTLRHELAHLALHEFAGASLEIPAWFDEGYSSFAAGEWGRDEVLASSFALALRGVPHLEALDAMIAGGSLRAEQGYALAHRAVADLAARDPANGLTRFLRNWKDSRRLDAAVRQTYGLTLTGFETEWRRMTRRRYGVLALFADVGFASLVLLLALAPFWITRRKRDRDRLAALLAADVQAERRERESALAALLEDPAGEGGAKAENDGGIKET